MRIEWKEDNALAVSASLEQIRQEMETCMRQAHQVTAALKEADPDGTNKRLKMLSERFDAAVDRIRRATEDADELEDATNYMIRTFEDSECEVIRLLNSLDPGRGNEEESGGTMTGYVPAAPVRPAVRPPITLPRPRIAPVMRFSPLGPVMGWLIEMITRL